MAKPALFDQVKYFLNFHLTELLFSLSSPLAQCGWWRHTIWPFPAWQWSLTLNYELWITHTDRDGFPLTRSARTNIRNNSCRNKDLVMFKTNSRFLRIKETSLSLIFQAHELNNNKLFWKTYIVNFLLST